MLHLSIVRWALPMLLVAVLLGCASAPPPAWQAAPMQLELASAPFFAQADHQCGPAALATLLVHSGVTITPEQLSAQVYLPERQASLALELQAAARRHGRLAYPLQGGLSELLAELQAGRPVLVLQNLGLDWLPRWHFAVVIGIDQARQRLILRSGQQQRLELQLTPFLATWRRGGQWALVTLPPDAAPALPDAERWFTALAALEQAGQGEAAAAGYRRFSQRYPSDARGWYGLGNVAYGRRDFAAAEAAWRQAVAADPQHAASHNNLAELYADQGRYDAGRPHAETAVRLLDIPATRATLQRYLLHR